MPREQKIKWAIITGQALMLAVLLPGSLILGVYLP